MPVSIGYNAEITFEEKAVSMSRGVRQTLLAAVLALAAAPACAFPERPVRLVLGFAPGGAPDVIARVVAKQLTAQLGQSVVLDNRAGANGIVAADVVANANPDGHTLLVTPGAFAINPSIYRKLPFDPTRSFAPVTNLCTSEALLLVIGPAVSAQSVRELIQLAKRPDAKFAYGTSGVGNVTHIAGALFAVRTGTTLTHVPYKGGGPMTTGLLAGEIQLAFTNPATIIGTVKSGRVRAIAYNGPARTPLLPDVPTMMEAGVTGMEMPQSWYGVFAPARTAAAIVDKLHAAIRTAIADRGVRDAFTGLNVQADGRSPAEFKAFVAEAIRRYGELVKLAGIPRE
jgi:tripartite-type tricarboxylate transporter receptor subunit TctC